LLGGVAGDVAGETGVRADVDKLNVVKTQCLPGVVNTQVRMIDERYELTLSDPTDCNDNNHNNSDY